MYKTALQMMRLANEKYQKEGVRILEIMKTMEVELPPLIEKAAAAGYFQVQYIIQADLNLKEGIQFFQLLESALYVKFSLLKYQMKLEPDSTGSSSTLHLYWNKPYVREL